MYDLIALGELLIDFIPAKSQGDSLGYEGHPGGAPANVLATVAKLGGKVAFIGKLGQDQFGIFLKDVLKSKNIGTDGLIFTEEANTALSFVNLDEHGERSFSFYRDPAADILLKESDVRFDLIDQAKAFHFGSVSMTDEPSRTATLTAAKYAKDKGKLVSYDPNLRPLLWKSEKEAKTVMVDGLEYADILKVSDEEMEFLTGIKDYEKGSDYLRRNYDIPLVLITLGARGCFYRFGSDTGHIKGYKVSAIDSTGAGDCFLGTVLFQILYKYHNKILMKFTVGEIEDIVKFSNAAGALSTTRKGGMSSVPSWNEILFLAKEGSHSGLAPD